MLKRTEEAAREKGATLSIVDTFSFHAPEFYRVNDYELFGTLNDFPKGHTRYYFSKKLY